MVQVTSSTAQAGPDRTDEGPVPGVPLSVHLVNVQKALPVSPLALLGASATLLSTCTLVPHLVHAFRSGHPGGSTMGWALGFLSSFAWFAYGIVDHDIAVAAPGIVTLPVGAALAVWCYVAARRHGLTAVSDSTVVDLLPSSHLSSTDSGDTVELPLIA